MKKLFAAFFALIFIAVLLCSCGSVSDSGLSSESTSTPPITAAAPESEAPASTSSEQTEPDEDAQKPAFLTFDEVQAAYPDKTVIVWCLPDFHRTELEVNAEVNEYLDSLGKDYAVYFKLLPYTSADGDYIDLVKKRIADGEPTDILYSAEITEDSAMTFSYHSYVLDGLYEPLDGYFADTELGRKLYNQMPENYWRLLSVDGKIYAADGSAGNYCYPFGYCVNKELAEKYGFDIQKPVSEQLDILEAVKKGESSCDIVFFPVKMGKAAYYSEVFEGLNGIVYGYASDSLIRLTDDKTFSDRLFEINALARAGYVNSNNSTRAKTFFISFAAADAVTAGKVGSIGAAYHSDDTPIEVINVYDNGGISFKIPNTATGVCSRSEQKDRAFDLLATVMTDGYLNDLLSGGEGGQASVVFADKFKNEAVSSIAESNELYLSALAKAELPPFIGFCFDASPVAEGYVKVRNVLTNYDFAQAEAAEDILEDVNKKLDEAGIAKVLDEANRQYKEWRDNQ